MTNIDEVEQLQEEIDNLQKEILAQTKMLQEYEAEIAELMAANKGYAKEIADLSNTVKSYEEGDSRFDQY